MTKKEFKIGEVFQCGLAKLRCEKAETEERCLQCSLYNDLEDVCCGFRVGSCDGEDREDHTDVIFKLVEE